ncbi:MazG family protein [Myceligenerans indicum]|uniref:MazG family protein n=1 Tax=Myceligenerans indicum TaxID=2593663 RepID=A0ABS1LJ48_9MICO|nr:MazG family protein [Myceligenerans indicum]MBL0885587.1 MazG family protein [Myceligenerans indicum]
MDELRRAVDVMDRLYSPGGCPWDRKQTHTSLVPYLLEEAHELAEAIESGDRDHMREELGDVLLQVLFHARIAAEEPEPFAVGDVARDLADKLVRRHPHVFVPDGQERSADDVLAGWEDIKQAEKQRTSVLEGIPLAQGALARAQKVVSRAAKAGIAGTVHEVAPGAAVPGAGEPGPARENEEPASYTLAERYGAELLDVVRRAQADGVDAEQAMRAASRALEEQVRAAESAPTA